MKASGFGIAGGTVVGKKFRGLGLVIAGFGGLGLIYEL